MNRSPHSGHSIRSESIRMSLSGGIECPHFWQVVLSDASTLARLIFCFLGIVETAYHG